MNDFLLKLFAVETINKLPIDRLYPILENIENEHLELIRKSYDLDFKGLTHNKKLEKLNDTILKEFKNTILQFDEKEHKSFYDFYNAAVDYTDENVYINMKKFTSLGLMYLFLSKTGTYFNFIIPVEIIEIYENLLMNS